MVDTFNINLQQIAQEKVGLTAAITNLQARKSALTEEVSV